MATRERLIREVSMPKTVHPSLDNPRARGTASVRPLPILAIEPVRKPILMVFMQRSFWEPRSAMGSMPWAG
jgi:hypothetical protein